MCLLRHSWLQRTRLLGRRQGRREAGIFRRAVFSRHSHRRCRKFSFADEDLQIFGKLDGGGIAIPALLGHRSLEQRFAIGQQARIDLSNSGDGVKHVLHHDLGRRICAIRLLATQHLKQDHPKRIDVAATIELLVAMHLLGAHVGRRSDHRARFGQRGGASAQTSNSEVSQIGLPIRIEEDIGWLEVSMDHAAVMRVIEGTRNPSQDRRRLIE